METYCLTAKDYLFCLLFIDFNSFYAVTKKRGSFFTSVWTMNLKIPMFREMDEKVCLLTLDPYSYSKMWPIRNDLNKHARRVMENPVYSEAVQRKWVCRVIILKYTF